MLLWTVIVPVKRFAAAKTRLRGALPGVPHERLVLALVVDTLAAVVDSPAVGEVIVVGDEPTVADEASRLGASLLDDVPGSGLNAAVLHGAAHAQVGAPVVALAGDLPALRPEELTAALSAAAHNGGRTFVSDAAGSGTTLLAALIAADLRPAFGADSARQHARSGATRLCGDWPGLRHDADTAADLARLADLGVGPRTAALLA